MIYSKYLEENGASKIILNCKNIMNQTFIYILEQKYKLRFQTYCL